MFAGIKSFVAELESTANVQIATAQQVEGSTPGSPGSIEAYRPALHRRTTSGTFSTMPSESAAALAENALSGLRRSIRSGAHHVSKASRGSLDLLQSGLASPRSPLDSPFFANFIPPSSMAGTSSGFVQAPIPAPKPIQREPMSLLSADVRFSVGDESGSVSRASTPGLHLGLDEENEAAIEELFAPLPPDTIPEASEVNLASPTLAASIALPAEPTESDHIVMGATSLLEKSKAATTMPPIKPRPISLLSQSRPRSNDEIILNSVEVIPSQPSIEPPGDSVVDHFTTVQHFTFPSHSVSTFPSAPPPNQAVDFVIEQHEVDAPRSRKPSLTIEIPKNEFAVLQPFPSVPPEADPPAVISDQPSHSELNVASVSLSEQEISELPAETEKLDTPSLPQPAVDLPVESTSPTAHPRQLIDVDATNALFSEHSSLSSGITDLKALEIFLRSTSHQTEILEHLRGQLERTLIWRYVSCVLVVDTLLQNM